MARGVPRKPDDSLLDVDVVIARVVLRGRPSRDATVEGEILLEALTDLWPHAKQGKFLATAGGFFRLPFPGTWRGRAGWESTPTDLAPLLAFAQGKLDKLILPQLCRAATGKVEVVTLGVDLEPLDDNGPDTHAELVAVVDVRRGRIVAWTGESYPVAFQDKTLVHVADLKSHLVEVAGERLLVLGSHDLDMFSPMAWANQDSSRRRRCEQMVRLVRRFRPTVALQHPHQTDSARIWGIGWSCLLGTAPTSPLRGMDSIKAWASGIAYYNADGPCRSDLTNVLVHTREGSGIDLAMLARGKR